MIIIKTRTEIETMREGGRILSDIIKEITDNMKDGISSEELNILAEKLISRKGGMPSFKNYRQYPKAICVSINDEVVHGIPSEEKTIKKGDIVGLDLGLKYKGLYTDMAVTVPIGKVSKKAKRLINVAKKCLELGLKQIRPGHRIGDISYAIQSYAEANGFAVVRDLVGHGVGKEVHEDPTIPNYGEPKTGLSLEEGMVIAIEPMLTEGDYQVTTDEDGWTVRTKDKSLAAHFEVTAAVTRHGYSVLTK